MTSSYGWCVYYSTGRFLMRLEIGTMFELCLFSLLFHLFNFLCRYVYVFYSRSFSIRIL